MKHLDDVPKVLPDFKMNKDGSITFGDTSKDHPDLVKTLIDEIAKGTSIEKIERMAKSGLTHNDLEKIDNLAQDAFRQTRNKGVADGNLVSALTSPAWSYLNKVMQVLHKYEESEPKK